MASLAGCVPVPSPPIPSLPDTINLLPPLPKFSTSLPNPCCLPPIKAKLNVAKLLPPLTVNTVVGKALKVASKAARAWIAAHQPKCPRQ